MYYGDLYYWRSWFDCMTIQRCDACVFWWYCLVVGLTPRDKAVINHGRSMDWSGICPSATNLITQMAASRVRVVGQMVNIISFDGGVW